MANIFGTPLKRREDPRLITGQAKYTDDFTLPGMAHLAVVRSPYAHARITRVDTKRAASMPGVLAVFTGQQMKDAGFGSIPCAWVVPNANTKTPPYPPIAIDTVRYVGNAVAIVIADDRYRARDAADAVEVDYDPLPAVVDAVKATRPGAALARYDAATGDLTFWVTSQNPHIVRFLIGLTCGIPEHKAHVIAPEVGGGFGSKIPHYPEDAMTIFA